MSDLFERQDTMKNFRQYASILIAGILLLFLIKPFMQTQTQLKDVTFHIQWHWVIPSFGMQILYRCIYTAPLATLFSGISGEKVAFRDAFTLFHLSNITRYLPGRIWGVVRLLSLSQRFGLSKTATASSLTLHVGVETTLGGLIALSLFCSKHSRDTAENVLEKVAGQTLFLTLALIGMMAVFVFLIPRLATSVRAFLKTIQDTGTPLLENSNLWVKVIRGHVLLWCCQGLAFFLFVKSLASVQWAEAGVLTASFAFAWSVGFLSFLTPGGLGIREGLLGLLLANYMPTPQATLVALLCRLWMLSAEILLAGTAFLLHKKDRYD